MHFTLETIAFNIESCHAAVRAGAHRLELCAGPLEGGTTPSFGFVKAARKAAINLQLFAMIRPRGGDFLYAATEFELMKTDIEVCKALGCDGVVFGILKEDATVDMERCKTLVNLAYPMSVTFHRAFDRVANAQQALEDVIECGFERILSSGGYPTAMQGLQNLKNLVEQAKHRIIVMPGSGINSSNIKEIADTTCAEEFHSSARADVASSMKTFNHNMCENLTSVGVNEQEIIKMLQMLLTL